jgi:hypothetical protein
MRSIKVIYILIILLGWSCENRLDLSEWKQPEAIVYGMICPLDSIHYVRISRSFFGEKNIESTAKNSDSLYFNNAEVYLEVRGQNGEILQRNEMKRIEYIEKLPGYFATSPNYLYQFKSKDLIRPHEGYYDLKYTLTIYLPEQDKAIFAESLMPPLPDGLKPQKDKIPFELDLYGQLEPLKISWRRSMRFYIQLETRVNYL